MWNAYSMVNYFWQIDDDIMFIHNVLITRMSNVRKRGKKFENPWESSYTYSTHRAAIVAGISRRGTLLRERRVEGTDVYGHDSACDPGQIIHQM